VPPLATRTLARWRLPIAWAIGGIGYAIGLAGSAALDLPSGPAIVWTLVAVALVVHAAAARRALRTGRAPEGERSAT